jgi:hypothetical protein
VDTLDMTATSVVARPVAPLDIGAVAPAPADEPAVTRWPGWARLVILIGGAAGLWAGIGWIAFRVLKLG